MSRRSRLFRPGLISGVGALVAGIAFFAGPSQEAHAGTGCSHCYVVVTPAANPATARAGTGQVYAFQVTNKDTGKTLRSLTFTAPADFVITGASGPAGTWPSALPASSVTLNLPNNWGSTFAIDITALAPCLAARSEVWGVSGTDTRGEPIKVRWNSSPLSVSVTGKCRLAFTGQPAETAVGSDILTGFDSTGSPLSVQLLDANNDPLNPADFSASRTPVTVSIKLNPGGATLSGTTTVTSSNGVAEFRNLKINKPGVGYKLEAQAPGFIPATSRFFTITGQIRACGTGPCTASQWRATTAASATAPSQPGHFITMGLGGVALTCDQYQAVSDVAAFNVFNASGAGIKGAEIIGTLTVSKWVAESAHRSLWQWQLCYGSRKPFPTIPGTSGRTVIAGTTYYTGLLLSCHLFPPGHPQPCLKSRQRTQSGAVTLTFIAVGDPIAHD